MDGKKLQRLRKEKGYSITKLGQLTGISKSYLSLIERDIQTNPSLEILEKISKALEVDVEHLVKNKEDSIISNNRKKSVKSVLKVEIELSEDQLSPQKLKQIKAFIAAINADE
ncbi:helix-turn-helix domain-containing protein [Bacillus sp. FJAT-29953]|nr:helix-turn-helix domain-containing protein [Bacillus sp. FJAT-29953]